MKAQFEVIEPQEAQSFKAFSQSKPEFDSPWHYHPEYELTYILSSKGIRYVGNHFEDFDQDDLVLLGPNLPHCWKTSQHSTDPAAAVVVQWKEDFLGKDWFSHPEFSSIKRLLHLSARGIKFSAPAAKAIKAGLLELVSLSSFERLIRLLQILQALTKTNCYELLCSQAFSYQLNYLENERINTVYQFLKNNYQKKITLRGMSSEVNMSEESFSRFFSKIMKKTFFSFLNEYRINEASKLLIETNLSIIQIAYTCGYESLPFFHRQFKRFRKYPPNQYRTRYQNLAYEQ